MPPKKKFALGIAPPVVPKQNEVIIIDNITDNNTKKSSGGLGPDSKNESGVLGASVSNRDDYNGASPRAGEKISFSPSNEDLVTPSSAGAGGVDNTNHSDADRTPQPAVSVAVSASSSNHQQQNKPTVSAPPPAPPSSSSLPPPGQPVVIKQLVPNITLLKDSKGTKFIRKVVANDYKTGKISQKGEREIQHLKERCGHPNLVRYLNGVCHTDGTVDLDLEFGDAGQADHFANFYSVGSSERRSIVKSCARQLLAALSYYYEVINRYHRDVKPQNCFLRFDGCLKLGDFDVSKSTGESSTVDTSLNRAADDTVIGTTSYMAPEMIHSPNFNPMRADVWSVGITLMELLEGKNTLESLAKGSQFFIPNMLHVQQMDWSLLKDDSALEYLMRKCLQVDPAKRFSLIECISATLILRNPLATENPDPRDVWSTGFMKHAGSAEKLTTIAKSFEIELCDMVIAAHQCLPPRKAEQEGGANSSGEYNVEESKEVYIHIRAVADALRKEAQGWKKSLKKFGPKVDKLMKDVWKLRCEVAYGQLAFLLKDCRKQIESVFEPSS